MLKEKGMGYYSLNQVGSHMPIHRPVGVLTFTSNDIEDMIEKIKLINNTISVTDTEDEDIIIRYTDFENLRTIYSNGLKGL